VEVIGEVARTDLIHLPVSEHPDETVVTGRRLDAGLADDCITDLLRVRQCKQFDGTIFHSSNQLQTMLGARCVCLC